MSPIPSCLKRYRDAIPDPMDFFDALRRPFAVHARVNLLRTTPEALFGRLERHGARCTMIDGQADAFHIEGLSNPGATLEYFLGGFHLQALSSMIPARVLDPGPVDRVLDLCAAPGSKTTHVAQRMGNRGIIIANEPTRGRLGPLKSQLERLGVTNTRITRYQGQVFPGRNPPWKDPEGRPDALRFDRILVDPPCSSEGTLRFFEPEREARSDLIRSRPRLVRRQHQLLTRAYRLLRPGGFLIYSTCTYAPEENEGVVNAFLEETDARMLPIHHPGPLDRALPEWNGVRFREEVRHAVRIYPHRMNTVGFFVARFTKPADIPDGDPRGPA